MNLYKYTQLNSIRVLNVYSTIEVAIRNLEFSERHWARWDILLCLFCETVTNKIHNVTQVNKTALSQTGIILGSQAMLEKQNEGDTILYFPFLFFTLDILTTSKYCIWYS